MTGCYTAVTSPRPFPVCSACERETLQTKLVKVHIPVHHHSDPILLPPPPLLPES